MFAFALWDRRERKLLVARDRLGKKPLFYRDTADAFWFGSEPKSILQDPEVPRDVNHEAIDAFLQLQYVPHPLSAFASLKKLPPASYLVWQDGRTRVEKYWELSYATDPASGSASFEELCERVRSGLVEATRLRLRSDVPLGAFLSGGVDSSAVVAAMSMAGSSQVRTFSIGFDVESYDETAYARQVAEQYGTEHHEFKVHPEAMEVLPKLVWHYGEPFADSSAIPSFYLAELTRRHVTVALNGDGGDESFAGYTRYVGNSMAERVAQLPGVARRALALAGRIAGSPVQDSSFRSRLRRVTQRALLEPDARYSI